MSLKRLLFFCGLCALFSGCTTGRYGDTYQLSNETTTHKAFRYLTGRGVQQDRVLASQYFQQAALAGDPLAQNELAYLYASGKGVTQNYTKALHWYKQAANHGVASAQYNLGLMYLHGLGTAKDPKVAREWMQKSAENGFEPAHLALSQNQD